MTSKKNRDNRWFIFCVVAVGVFMSTLDSSMVNVALPSILHDFGSPFHKTEWVVLIYLLTISSTLLLWGGLSDFIGRRKIYSLGLFIFASGSLACAYAPDLNLLITARFIQALGASMMMSTGPAIIKETFPPDQLGRSLGLIGIAVSLGLMTGPPISGFLIDFFSWRSIFLCTVPVGFLFFLLAKSILPPSPARRSKIVNFDWPGALVWAVLLTALSFVLSHAASPTWKSAQLITAACIGLTALVLFILIESRAKSPLLPFSFFRERFFVTGILSATLSFMVLFCTILLTPFYLTNVLGYSGSNTGLVMMAIPVSVMLVAPAAGWIYDHVGARYLTTIGLILSTGGTLLLTGLSASSTMPGIAARLAIIGFGQALFLSPNSASVLTRVKKEHNGTSAALLATARNLGMLLGIALAGLVFSISFSRYTGGLDVKDFGPQHVSSFLQALRNSFYAAAGTGLVGVVVSWCRESRTELKRLPEYDGTKF